jgi:hypothetical protein
MNVNDIYTDITTFWESIYPIIVFHIIFYFVAKLMFGSLDIKGQLEKCVASDSFQRTKKIMEQFELWTKLPFIILLGCLIYLALFRSFTDLVSSIPVVPFRMTYSET